MINPFQAMETAISAKCEADLKLRTLVLPEDVSIRQKADQYLTISFDRINTVRKLDKSIRDCDCLFSFVIEFKDLGLKGTVKDFLWSAVVALTNYQPYQNFEPLELVSAGYTGYSEATGFIKYSAVFQTSLLWDLTKQFELLDFNPIDYSDRAIDLSIYSAQKLPSLDDAQLIQESIK